MVCGVLVTPLRQRPNKLEFDLHNDLAMSFYLETDLAILRL